MIRVIGLGAGGHARVMLETLAAMGGFEVVGLLAPDRTTRAGLVAGIPVTGGDEKLDEYWRTGVRHAFVGVGSGANTQPRRQVFDRVRQMGFTLVAAIHPSALVSPSATTGLGVSVMPFAVVGTQARLGDNVLINTSAVVEHDCIIGDHVHVATGAKLAGAVHVGDGCHIGIGAALRQGVSIGANVVMGAGAAVVNDVADGVTVVGVPAREIGVS